MVGERGEVGGCDLKSKQCPKSTSEVEISEMALPVVHFDLHCPLSSVLKGRESLHECQARQTEMPRESRAWHGGCVPHFTS